MNINIEIIPPEQQRANVDGCDWFWDAAGNLQVRVSPMSDWRRETLLAIHEAVEAIMCKKNGVTQEAVDQFDIEFDKNHPDEPDLGAGDDRSAPYHREHCFATAIESILCIELGVDWNDYCKELGGTYPGPSKKKT